MFRKNLILLSFLFLSVGNAWWATLYYNAATNTNWNTLTNWWQDSGFTIQATSLPTVGDDVIVSASVLSNTGGDPTINTLTVNGWTNVSLNITVINGATFNNSTRSTFGKTITGNVTFNNSSSHRGTITGNATFNNNSGITNFGAVINGNATFNNSSAILTATTITGLVTFNGNSSFGDPFWSTVLSNAIFNDSSINHWRVSGTATFNGSSINSTNGIVGTAIFNDNSSNSFEGQVTGNADVYYPSANPIGGTVGGTVTYHNYPDTTPPVQSSIVVTPGVTTATVTLTTDEATTSTISYGPTSSYGTTATINWVAVTNHSGSISGLSSCGATYHYQINTTDAANNTSSSADGTFITHCGSTGGGGYSAPLPSPSVQDESTPKTITPVVPKEDIKVPNIPTIWEVPSEHKNEDIVVTTVPQKSENRTIFSTQLSVIKNDPSYVSELQQFFNKYESETLSVTGNYDKDTQEAVKRFQLKYASEILAPWGISKPTGNVGVFTLAKINRIAS